MSIGSLLLASGFITTDQLQEALDYQHEHPSRRLGEIIVQLGFASQRAVDICLAKQADLRHR